MPVSRKQRNRTKCRLQRQIDEGRAVRVPFTRSGQILLKEKFMSDIPDLKELMNGAQPAQVSHGVVQALQMVLDQARRGQVHAVVIVGVNGADNASFDVTGIDNPTLGLIAIGALEIAKSKVVEGLRRAQQQTPVSKIVRPPAGMAVS